MISHSLKRTQQRGTSSLPLFNVVLFPYSANRGWARGATHSASLPEHIANSLARLITCNFHTLFSIKTYLTFKNTFLLLSVLCGTLCYSQVYTSLIPWFLKFTADGLFEVTWLIPVSHAGLLRLQLMVLAPASILSATRILGYTRVKLSASLWFGVSPSTFIISQ